MRSGVDGGARRARQFSCESMQGLASAWRQPMKPRSAALLRALLVLLLCLGLPLQASGATVCVPADMTLAAALNQAQSSATTIHLVQGTHDLAATVWHRGLAKHT